MGAFAEFARFDQHVLAVHVRQAEIEHDDVRRGSGDQAQGLRARLAPTALIARSQQCGAEKTLDRRLVVDDQHAGLHVFSSLSTIGGGKAHQQPVPRRRSRRALRLDLAAHRLDQPLADRQAKAGAGLAAVHPAAAIEFLENRVRDRRVLRPALRP